MKIDWNRVKRTLIQTGSGAGIALVTAVSANWSKEAVITASIQFASSVIIAVLMNIKSQAEEQENR